MTPRKPALVFIFITVLLDVLGFGLLIPAGPLLVEEMMHAGEKEAAPVVGLLMSTFFVMLFLFAPLWGVLSDRFGRRPILLIALLGAGLDYFGQALAPSIGWLFLTRAINGFTGGSITVANAYIADVTPPEKRAPAYGMIGAAFGIGFVLGPALGGVLGGSTLMGLLDAPNIRIPFYVAGVVSLLNCLYGYFVLPESLPRELRAPLHLSRANPIGAMGVIARYPVVLGMAATYFLLNLAQFGLHATWVLSMKNRFSWTPFEVGMSLFVVGVGAAVVQGGLTRLIVPRIGERKALLLGLGIATLAYFAYGAATHGWMIYAIIAIASIGAVWQPAAQAIVTRAVPADQQGTVQGAMTSLQSIAGIIGPLIGGPVLAWSIIHSETLAMIGANFYVSAILCLLAVVAGAVTTRHLSSRQAPPVEAPAAHEPAAPAAEK